MITTVIRRVHVHRPANPLTVTKRSRSWIQRALDRAAIQAAKIASFSLMVLIAVAFTVLAASLWYSYCLAAAVYQRLLVRPLAENEVPSPVEPFREYWFAAAWSDLAGTIGTAFTRFQAAVPTDLGGTESKREDTEQWFSTAAAVLAFAAAMLSGACLSGYAGLLYFVAALSVYVACYAASAGQYLSFRVATYLHQRSLIAAPPALPKRLGAPIWLLRRCIGGLVLAMWATGGALIVGAVIEAQRSSAKATLPSARQEVWDRDFSSQLPSTRTDNLEAQEAPAFNPVPSPAQDSSTDEPAAQDVQLTSAVSLPVGSDTTQSDSTVGANTDPLSNSVYYDFQVEHEARQIGSESPEYPMDLASAGIAGECVVQFVVKLSGIPDPTTIRVLRSPHPLLSASVRTAVAKMVFIPAEIGGRRVNQLLQRTFSFAPP